ncbi:cell surface lipoprotein [Methanolobus sp. ZRKC5]|uniref:cell surface lipoprotein n=1 Tax=unclassified Methanolobus TaxID=2629569 RepID=UPI00313D2DD3
MTKKWLICIILLMLAGVFVSGCADNAEDTVVDEVEEASEDVVEDFEPIIGEAQDYAVRMEYYGMMKPSELEINRGDSIAWRNYKPQNTYVLVSDDGLFDDQEMDSNDVYTYTFMESGTYTFSVTDVPDMTLSVTIR